MILSLQEDYAQLCTPRPIPTSHPAGDNKLPAYVDSDDVQRMALHLHSNRCWNWLLPVLMETGGCGGCKRTLSLRLRWDTSK